MRFKVVPASTEFRFRASHLYHSAGILRRLVLEFSNEASHLRRAWLRLRAIARYREQGTTRHNLEAGGGAGFLREVFETVGGFDETLQRSEDADMGARLREHGIKIYYHPFHHVRHHHESLPKEALARQFRSGSSRYHFHRKHESGGRHTVPAICEFVLGRVLASAEVVLCSFRAGLLLELLLFAPLLVLLEAANKLGHLTSMRRDADGRGRRNPPKPPGGSVRKR